MISKLLPLHDLLSSQPDQKDMKVNSMFTIDQLFNPLVSFETETAGDDDSSDLSSSICYSCQLCKVELSRLVSEHEQDDEGIMYCKPCADERRRKGTQRRVHFAEENDINIIHYIPSHRDYSDEEYYGMWYHPDELEDNAYRNRIEYHFEGHWKLVLEEDQFTLCSDGKLYHPVTVNLYLRHLKEQQQQQQRRNALKEGETTLGISFTTKQTKRNTTSDNKENKVNHSNVVVSSRQSPSSTSATPTTATTTKPNSLRTNNIVVPNLADTTIPRLTACVA